VPTCTRHFVDSISCTFLQLVSRQRRRLTHALVHISHRASRCSIQSTTTRTLTVLHFRPYGASQMLGSVVERWWVSRWHVHTRRRNLRLKFFFGTDNLGAVRDLLYTHWCLDSRRTLPGRFIFEGDVGGKNLS
jgi:hypothetical protein